jgi:xanthine dehydrogenase YagS FAD-binding subunit
MNRFAYASVSTVDEALEALADTDYPDGCLPMAGGVDLLDRMKEGLVSPMRLVNLKRIPGLDRVREDASGLHIGALVPLYCLLADPAISDRVDRTCLRQALTETASPQIRHMATVGGNLLQRPRCWYFRNKLTDCLRKGGARCFAFRGENERHAILGGGPCYIAAAGSPAERQGVYLKVPERGARDFALASVALQLAFAGEAVREASVVLGGVAPVPWRATEAERALAGQTLGDAVIEQASLSATAGARPLAKNAFKIELVQGLVKQALCTLREANRVV